MKAQSHPGRESGFSTIELMVALILTTIMMGASIPALSRYLKSHELLGSVENFAANMRLCRQKATTQGNNVVFSWNTGTMTYSILDDLDNNGSANNGEPTIGPIDLPDGMTLTNGTVSPFSGTSVTFLPSGSTSEGGRLTITNGAGLTRDIILLRPTSLVKVQ